ncbi:hypothetical protein ACFV98_02910 [Streptomyces violascens]|uniref:hypothetical protein n=1 Tax=Streptomyces violascens TaxID=67381 RepID=UPI003651E42E
MSMSPLLAEHDLLVRSSQFCSRVRMAFARIAREVMAESPDTHGNPLRVAFARTVLSPADLAGPGQAAVIATDATVSAAALAAYAEGQPDAAQAAVTDEQILTAVRAAWNITAGVSPAPADGATS